MQTAEIRRAFLDHFARHEHDIVPSTSLIYNDPTLLFVNAGMVPFKSYFTGAEASPYRRAASVQKCLRTLDIDEVGKTVRHGTFFQMGGNFSFGDYFKKEAIEFAWELVTNPQSEGGFGFDPNRIWVTAYHDDDETVRLWQKTGVPRDRIQLRGLKDNYWHMGVPGPGGPCSEIYFDRGPDFGPEGGPEADEDRFLEIWNLVFQTEELSQIRAKDDFDVLRTLPSQNIDTGMGIERVAFLLQDVGNMYECDEVYPVIQRACEIAGVKYGDDKKNDIALRVVADHVRSSLMIMTDGVSPGNEARGYVLRRLLRRSIRAMRLLGVQDRVLVELLDASKQVMSKSYPEIDTEWRRVSVVAQAEEDAFLNTLHSGSQRFDQAVAVLRKEGGKTLSGSEAFRLHDTYGFPIDLTLEMASEVGLGVDEQAFRNLMAEQKERARADAISKKGPGANPQVYRELRDGGETPFRGYKELTVETKVRGIIVGGEISDHADEGQVAEVVLEETPFYAEAGGQDSDSGTITGAGYSLKVLDVQQPTPGLTVHKVEVTGLVQLGADAKAEVDPVARKGSCQAHTGTHVLHAALRELVGPGALQAGSYNKPGYLRFDFTSTQGLSPSLVAEIEERCNTAINDDLVMTEQTMPLEEAKRMGAMAMFGEKYPPIVRVVEMDGSWSRELCGGTHVSSSAQIGLMTLVQESSIGSGVRRVEALVSKDAFKSLAAERALVSTLTSTLKVQPDQLVERVERLVGQLKTAERQIAALTAAQLRTQTAAFLDNTKRIGSYEVVAEELPNVSAGDLRTIASELRDKAGDRSVVIALVSGDDEKRAAVVSATASAQSAGAHAGKLIGTLCSALGGRGGGKPDLAQGGATGPADVTAAFAAMTGDLAG